VIEIRGINPYVYVAAKAANRLKAGWRKAMPVLVRINGRPKSPARINLMPIGDGSFYLYLRGSLRKASGTGVGDRVNVEVSFDDSYRGAGEYAMPSWFAAALRANRRAKKA
jgi:AhpD family alkylhydroperoxidase